MIVVTVSFEETPDFCPCESDDDGGDPELLTESTTGLGVDLNWCRN